jgi:hypothetical protein
MKHLNALILTFFIIFATSVKAAPLEEPNIPIEQAINVAKQHLTMAKIDMKESYIAKAEWHPRSGLLSYWRIEWSNKKYVKGGDTYLTVYADGKVEHTFGK